MNLTRRRMLGTTAVASLATLVGRPTMAQSVRWDMADEYGAQALSGQAANFFIAELQRRIGDAVQITYQGGGALGYKSADHFDAVSSGAVQAAVTLLTQLGGIDPLFNLSSLPFIANSPEDAYKLWQAARAEYAKVFEENGMVLLWAMPNPPSGVNAPVPITTRESLAGLRIRTYDVNGTKTLINAGAAPLQIAWADLIPQLSTGGINAVLTSADGAKQLSLWDYVTDFTELNYAMGLFVCHVNKDEFDALPEEVRAAMLDSVESCDLFNWENMVASIEAAYSVMRENGMTITMDDEVPAEVFAFLREASAPVHEEWLAQTGDRGAVILEAYEASRSS